MRVIDRAGPLVTVWLRLAFGALILAVLRPAWRSNIGRDAWRTAILFGVVLAAMNGAFYAALARIPLGVAVTLEFWGPLAVAVMGSRRPLDLLWVVLAAAGIVTLAGGRLVADDLLGVAFALAAGGCFALYILVGSRLTRSWPDGRALGVAMAVGALILAVPAVVTGGKWLLDPWVLLAGLVVATLSGVIPYTLELAALRSLPAGVFGVLTSLDPALAVSALVRGVCPNSPRRAFEGPFPRRRMRPASIVTSRSYRSPSSCSSPNATSRAFTALLSREASGLQGQGRCSPS